MVASGALYAILWACIRHASAQVHPFVIVFFRNSFGLLALAPWLIRTGRAAVRTGVWSGRRRGGSYKTVRHGAGNGNACRVDKSLQYCTPLDHATASVHSLS